MIEKKELPWKTVEQMKNASKEELLKVFGDGSENLINLSGLLKAVIEMDIERCLERGEEIPMRNIRGIWYYAVKSILSRLYSGEHERLQKQYFKNGKWYEHKKAVDRRITQRISKILVDIVFEEQRVTYEQLRIKDLTSWKRYSNQTVYGDVFLYVEKLTICDNIEHLSRLYDIPLFSGKGWTPKSLVEEIKNKLGTEQEYTVLCICDHDPTGDQIIREFGKAGNKLGMSLRVVKIAINKKDVSREIFEANKFEVPINKPNREIYDEWVIKHGTHGLELEALTANMFDKFLELVVGKLEEYCPERDMLNYVKEETFSTVSWQIASGITESLEDQLREKAREIVEDTRDDLPDGTLTGAAKAGQSEISMSTGELVRDGSKDVAELIEKIKVDIDPETKEIIFTIIWKE